MEKQTIIALSTALKETAGKVPHVNHGGCGVVAHALYSELKKIGEDPVIANFIPERAHMLVRLGDAYFDADGLWEVGEEKADMKGKLKWGSYYKLTDEYPPDELEGLLGAPYVWNSCFNWEDAPKVRTAVAEAVQKAYARARS